MARVLPVIAISLASFGACLGAAMLALAMPVTPALLPDCQLVMERFFATEQVAADGQLRVSYYVLLNNPEPRAWAYGLNFAHAAATERRIGARATLPGEHSLPVLLGREVLPPDGEALSPQGMATAVALTCRV